jgi:hypothetical protein
MKTTLAGIALVIAAATSSQAQAQAQVQPMPVKPVRVVAGIGLTTGGEKLVTVQYTDGSTDDVKSGGLVHFYLGAEFNIAPQFSLQANAGYHIDDTSGASNGSVRFSRYPIEFLGHYAATPQVRLGGGLRYVPSAKLDGSGVLNFTHIDFKSTTGLVLEGEYLFNPNFGVKLRYVAEDYEAEGGLGSVSGNHGGVYMSFYF